MKLSDKGLASLKELEGFRPKMYLDSAGLPTIGYGTLIDSSEEQYLKNATITESQATDLLKKQLTIYENAVNKGLSKEVSQGQYDALVLFCYNVGTGAFLTSTLLKKINREAPESEIKKEFLKWIYAGGKKVKGLINRRTAELSLFFSENSGNISGAVLAIIFFLIIKYGKKIYK